MPPSLTSLRTHLVEVKHQIQLTHIPKEAIQHLDKEVYGLEVRQLIIIRIDADAEEQPSIPPIHHAVLPELDEIGLMLLVPRRNQAVHLSLKLDLVGVGVRGVPFRQAGLASVERG
ncbi:hypothetical protein V500_00124, partial [Pseudogymnoascus sp. VKM F-4518 (FW-2643)]